MTVKKCFVQGTKDDFQGKTQNTSYIERFNLTLRQRVSYLQRKTLGYCKNKANIRDILWINLFEYNYRCHHKSLRLPLMHQGTSKFQKKWVHRTPAMAMSLTQEALTWRLLFVAPITAVNERDEIGSDLVPYYMTSVKEDAFYGWPYSYYGQHVDNRVQAQRPDLIAKAIAPDYALGAHTASLGLVFYQGNLLPKHYLGGAFIGQHGSWNREPRSGYKVIFVSFSNCQPVGMPEEILTDFLNAEGGAQGRPVGLAIDRAGAVLVADDVGNCIWRVSKAIAP